MPRTFTLGSRASKLAQVQTLIVRDALQTAHPDDEFELSFMTTGGDKNQSQALYLLGGKSLWTEELEEALLKGDIDIIVHSLKDVPTVLPEGCEIGAIMERENPSDSLVVKKGLPYKSLEELPDGSVVGTSSVRRVAQLRRAFPKLIFADVVCASSSHALHFFVFLIRCFRFRCLLSVGICKAAFPSHLLFRAAFSLPFRFDVETPV
jgi:hydroxymethylbilane synthase